MQEGELLTGCPAAVAVVQQGQKPELRGTVHKAAAVHIDTAVAGLAVAGRMPAGHWDMAAAGKVQHLLQVRSTTCHL
jgi:hypothetical protein